MSGEAGEGEALGIAALAALALLCYGGFKVYEEWRYSPRERLEQCQRTAAEQVVEIATLRSHVATLEETVNAEEYELQSGLDGTGREWTLDTFHGKSARNDCYSAASFWGSTGSVRYSYFCRISSRPH